MKRFLEILGSVVIGIGALALVGSWIMAADIPVGASDALRAAIRLQVAATLIASVVVIGFGAALVVLAGMARDLSTMAAAVPVEPEARAPVSAPAEFVKTYRGAKITRTPDGAIMAKGARFSNVIEAERAIDAARAK